MRWTHEEVEFLIINYPLHGGPYCTKKLNKNRKAIKSKAQRLGIKSCNNKKKTTDQYISELVSKNIDIYPIEEYAGDGISILHASLNCEHTWKASPNNILGKRSKCPSCVTKDLMEKPCKVYLVSFLYEDIRYYKIGITSQELKARFARDWFSKNMQEEWVIECSTRVEALILEKQLLSDNNNYKINTGSLISRGNTETLTVYVEKPCQ